MIRTDVPESSSALPQREQPACLGLGSNVEPRRHLRRAIRILRREVGVDAISTAWESPAVGLDGPDYVNAALLVRTRLSVEGLAARLKEVENRLGRSRTGERAAFVPIDIDIVVFDGKVQREDLWIQAYRAVPVAELMPDLSCPSTAETLAAVATRLALDLKIRPRPEILAGSPRTPLSREGILDSTRTRTR